MAASGNCSCNSSKSFSAPHCNVQAQKWRIREIMTLEGKHNHCYYIFFLYILMTIFPRGPGLAGTRMSSFWIILDFIEAKEDDGGSGDSSSYKTCKAPVKLSPPTPNFLQARCPSCCPTNSVRTLELLLHNISRNCYH